MEFKVKYRKSGSWFWKTLTVIGYIPDNKIKKYNTIEKGIQYLIEEQANDQAIFILPDLTKRIIPEWSKYEYIVGKDWLLSIKTDMEQQSGQKISLKE